MRSCPNSFLPQNSLARPMFLIGFLIAFLTLAAFESTAQTRDETGRFEKASLKIARPCTVGAIGELTALVKNGVELSVNEDFDCDGIPDAYDNCVGMPNRDQADTNANGVGDVCEAATTIKAPPASRSRMPAAKTDARRPKESTKRRREEKVKHIKPTRTDKHRPPSNKRRRR